jgi:hypothetical protein
MGSFPEIKVRSWLQVLIMGSCKPIHVNGAVEFEAREIVTQAEVLWIGFHNTHASNKLYVSFDGKNWRQVEAGGVWSLRGSGDMPITIDHCYIRGSGAGTTFEITYLKTVKEWPIM